MNSIPHNFDILTNLIERYVLPSALNKDPNGLSLSQYNILYYLYTHDQVRPKDLAYALCISSPAVTYALQRLESENLVEIIPSKEDKREKTVALTKDGDIAVSTITKAKEEIIEEILKELSATQRQSLNNGLEAFLQKAGVKIGQDKLCLKCGFAHSPTCILNNLKK